MTISRDSYAIYLFVSTPEASNKSTDMSIE